jgi:APA family basic amino acid/polyamine antiporter
VLKLVALAGLIAAALLLAPAGGPAAATSAAATPAPLPVGPSVVLALATAFVPVLFAYGGWQQTNFIAEELVEPERNLPRALVLGVLAVIAVYLLVNLAYLRVLGVSGLAASSAPAADTMEAVLGSRGRTLISVGILISTLGWLDLVIMVSPRVYQALAADGLFFRSFARLHPRFRTPVTAILGQGLWAALLLATRSYGQLLDYVTFADWIFFGSTAAALFVWRRRDRSGISSPPRFRLPGYPWTLLLFILASVFVVLGSIRSNPGNALRGALLLGVAVPVYLFWSRRRG